MPEMADVFLCHNSANKEAVEYIANRLENEGISVWLDTFNLIVGERFTPKIEAALESCETIAVFVGQIGRGPYQNEEFDYAVNVRGTRGARIIPVLLPGATPNMITGLLKNREYVQFPQSVDEIEPFRMLVGGIRGLPARQVVLKSEQPVPVSAAPPSPLPTECPYRPLAAFDVADHRYFCGRDQLTADVVSRVEAMIGDSMRCFSIVGGSGSGKSSLARAGVLWSLQQKHPDWTTIILEPGVLPHERLAERMLRLIHKQIDGPTLKDHGQRYLTDTSMLQASIFGALGSDSSGGRLLLLVDQFEEVFTMCESQKAREAFIGNLINAARDTDGKALVLICLRADFYENCAKTELADALSRQQILVGPLKRNELQSAIRDPAMRIGCEVEPELVISLARDCEEQPSPLPLLQIVLEKLWQKRDPQGRLTLATYETMSFEGALNEHAEGVYENLPDPQKKICQSLMLQLAEPFGDGRYARRRTPVDFLLPAVDTKREASFELVKQVETVLGILSGRRARLIAIRLEGGTPKAELAHESILRGWKRLASWLDQDSEFLNWKRRLRFDLADWKNPKTPGSVLIGGVLDRARTWLKERPSEHTDEEHKFIQASYRRHILLRTGLGAALAAVTALVVVGGLAIFRSRIGLEVDSATQQLGQNPAMALLVAYDAFKQEQSQRTRETLQRAVQQASAPLLEGDGLTDINLSLDGKLLAAAAPEMILVWSIVPSHQMMWPPLAILNPKTFAFDGRPTKIVVSPDATLIAAGDETGKVLLWRVQQQGSGTPFSAGSGILGLAFAADGHHLAIATQNKEVIWWNIQMGNVEGRVQIGTEAQALAVSPDSSTVAVGMMDGLVRFWKLPESRLRESFGVPGQFVNFLAFTKDGESIESGFRLGRDAYRWSKATRKSSVIMHINDELMDSETMDGDGHRFAAHTTSRSIVIFNGETGHVEWYLPGQSPDIFKVAMSSDGMVVAAAEPKGVRIYELGDKALAARARIKLRDLDPKEEDCERVLLKPSACKQDLQEIQ
jgi:hypothetical protein